MFQRNRVEIRLHPTDVDPRIMRRHVLHAQPSPVVLHAEPCVVQDVDGPGVDDPVGRGVLPADDVFAEVANVALEVDGLPDARLLRRA